MAVVGSFSWLPIVALSPSNRETSVTHLAGGLAGEQLQTSNLPSVQRREHCLSFRKNLHSNRNTLAFKSHFMEIIDTFIFFSEAKL